VKRILEEVRAIWLPSIGREKIADTIYAAANVIFFLICFGKVLDPENPDSLIVAIILFLIFWGITTLGHRKFLKSNFRAMKSKVKNHINTVNQTYIPKGLKWHLPTNFPHWVELWKDYHKQHEERANYMARNSLNVNYGADIQLLRDHSQYQQNEQQNANLPDQIYLQVDEATKDEGLFQA